MSDHVPTTRKCGSWGRSVPRNPQRLGAANGGSSKGFGPNEPTSRRVVGGSLELDRQELLLPHDPRIVLGIDVIHVPRPDLGLAAIVVAHVEPTLQHVANMVDLAAVGLRHQLDGLGPPPAGLEGVAADGCAL